MSHRIHFSDSLDDKNLKEIKKKSRNTTKFCSNEYKFLSKIADENIKKYNLKYAEMYAKLTK